MKQRMKRQLICYLLMIAMLLMGAQADIKPVNPSFLREESTVSTNAVSSVIRSVSYLVTPEDGCTIDMLRRYTPTYQSDVFENVSIRRFWGIAVILFVAELLLLQKFYFGVEGEFITLQLSKCHIITVRCIHRQDGKK